MPVRHGSIACIIAICTIPIVKAAEVDVSASNAQLIRAEHDELDRGAWRGAAELYAEDTSNHGKPVGRAGVRLSPRTSTSKCCTSTGTKCATEDHRSMRRAVLWRCCSSRVCCRHRCGRLIGGI